jgi:2,3-bisphosphoglycerate-dependent phosphoglycerate mutase
MKKYLILVKHSLPKVVETIPASEWKLSDGGRARAQQLAENLRSFEPEVIVSSDEPKAKETAEIVSQLLQLDVQVVPDLYEHDRSNVSYLSQEQFRTSVHKFFQKPAELVFGKETADQAHARFYRAVHFILNEHRNKTIVIVSHGTVISLFVSRLTGSSDFELWNMLGLPSFIAMDLYSNRLIVRANIV